MRAACRSAIAAGLLLALGGCAVAPTASDLLRTARTAGMRPAEFRHEGFAITMMWRATEPNRPLRIYIEGDGRAWLDRDTPSPDPTPRQAIALQLALADTYPNVAYLARPCQYSRARSPACAVEHWTARRFAPEVVATMDASVGYLLGLSQTRSVELVGYSGGAAIAVAVAARRADIRWLVSVAGNLDTEAVNRFHQVDPMPQSVNPLALAPRIAGLPQRHFRGDGDRVIPAEVATVFLNSGPMQSAVVIDVPGATHGDGWVRRWPALLNASWEKFHIPPGEVRRARANLGNGTDNAMDELRAK